MRYHFTSDTHYDHMNIVRYSDRPFAIQPPGSDPHAPRWARPSELGYVESQSWTWPQIDIDAMRETFIENWNRVVKPADKVYHLGDFAMGPGVTLRERVSAIRARLNGEVILILGNHDRPKRKLYMDCGFNGVGTYAHEKLQGLRVAMQHKPFSLTEDFGARTGWNHADLQLCGHVHELWMRKGLLINVGVDQWNYTPVSLDELATMRNI